MPPMPKINYECRYFVSSSQKCSIDLSLCAYKRNCPQRVIDSLKKCIATRDQDCLKYVKILVEVNSICKQCLDDELIRDTAIKIINTRENGLR